MSEFPLAIFLALSTFGLVIAFALLSKRRTQRRMDDENAEKSTLAKDGPGPRPLR